MAKKQIIEEVVEEQVEQITEAPKKAPKAVRYSNQDINDLLMSFKAVVEKEMNLRRQERAPGVVTKENDAQLQGLKVGLEQVSVRYKIFAKVDKAY